MGEDIYADSNGDVGKYGRSIESRGGTEMIWMILFFVGIVGLLVVAVFFADEDWSVWVGLPCAFLAIITMLIGIATEDKKPKVVHAKTPPQIDTVITIRSRIPDTTYIYTFSKEEQK